MKILFTFTALLTFLPLAWGQEWSYQTIGANRQPLNVGTFRLSEPNPGQYVGRIQAPDLDVCFRSELKAAVEKTSDQTLVVLEPLMSGCQRVRLVLNNDGSGGKREIYQSDGTWKWDERERLLKRLR
jgi:hypothetical protein